MRPLPLTVALWLLSGLLLTLLVVRVGPAIGPLIFPSPERDQPVVSSSDGVEELQAISLATQASLSRLRVRDPGGDGALQLPSGLSAEELQRVLRSDLQPMGAEVYVTPRGELLHRLRVYHGGSAVLVRDLRPSLIERPKVSTLNPPALGMVARVREAPGPIFRELLRWKAPLTVALPGLQPWTLRAARSATQAASGILVRLDGTLSLREAVDAIPGASGVLMEVEPPAGVALDHWLLPMQDRDLVLVDARSEAIVDLREVAAGAGIRLLRLAGELGPPGAAVLARNLSVRRGYGVVIFEVRRGDVQRAEGFVGAAREDGYKLAFVHELGGDR